MPAQRSKADPAVEEALLGGGGRGGGGDGVESAPLIGGIQLRLPGDDHASGGGATSKALAPLRARRPAGAGMGETYQRDSARFDAAMGPSSSHGGGLAPGAVGGHYPMQTFPRPTDASSSSSRGSRSRRDKSR